MPERFYNDEKVASILHLNLPDCVLCHLLVSVVIWISCWPKTKPCGTWKLLEGTCTATQPSMSCHARSRTWTQSPFSFCRSLRLQCFYRLQSMAANLCWNDMLCNSYYTQFIIFYWNFDLFAVLFSFVKNENHPKGCK